jgi:hypothetical protein
MRRRDLSQSGQYREGRISSNSNSSINNRFTNISSIDKALRRNSSKDQKMNTP